MSRVEFAEGTLNPHIISAKEIKLGDRLGYKVLVVIHADGPHVYIGSPAHTDDNIVKFGREIPILQVQYLFPTIYETYFHGE